MAERLRVEVLDPELCPRFVGRWVSGVARRSVAELGPDAADGRRPASDQQRRRRLELRHDRARQADPRVRRRGRPRRPDHRPPGGAGRAHRDARPRPAHARRRDPGHRRSARSDRDRRGDGRCRLRGRGRRPPRSPSNRPSSTPSASGEPPSDTPFVRRPACASRRARSSGLARVGADRTAQLVADWAGGSIAPGAVDSNPVEPSPARVAFRPAPRQPAARNVIGGPRAGGPARPGRDRDGTCADRDPDHGRRGVAAAGARREHRRDVVRDGPVLATGPGRGSRCDRGGHPGPRLRDGAADPAAYAHARVPALSARGARHGSARRWRGRASARS